MKVVRDSESGALLFSGVKEREDKVKKLEERIERLEKEVFELKERICDILYLYLERRGIEKDGKV